MVGRKAGESASSQNDKDKGRGFKMVFLLVNCRTGRNEGNRKEPPRVGGCARRNLEFNGRRETGWRQRVREKITYLQIKKLTLLESKPSFMVRIPRLKGKPGVADACMVETTLSRGGRESLGMSYGLFLRC